MSMYEGGVGHNRLWNM